MNNSGLADLSSLKRRLTAVFIAVTAVLVAGGLVYHRHYRAVLFNNAERLLQSTEQIKLSQVKSWREERISDTASLLDSPLLAPYLRRFAADRGDREAAGILRQRLRAYLAHNRYTFAAIADASGKVLVSAGRNGERSCPEIASLISKAVASGRPELGDFYVPPGEKFPHLDIAALAAKGPGAKDIFLLLRINPAEFLYPLLRTWSAKGDTGEILLVGRAGDEVVFLNDLRHVNNAAMKLRVPLATAGLPAAMALRGHAGVVRGRDYRGVDVLAAVSPVQGTNWAMVTKMDWAEVMRGTGTIAVMLVLLILAMAAAAGFGVFLIFSRQTEGYRAAVNTAQSKLSLSEDRFRLFFENSPLGKSITGLDGSVHVNKAFCGMLGYTEEELRGKKWQELTPAEDVPKTEAMVRSLVEGRRESVQFEKRYLRKDGGIVYAELTSAVQRDGAGRPEYLITTISDITARKQADEMLRQSSRLMESTQRLARIGGWEWNIDQKTMHWTGEMYRLHDLDPADIKPGPEGHIARSQQCYRPEDLPIVMAAFNRCAETGEPYDLEFPFTTLKGRKLWVRTTAQAERAGGRVIKVIGTLADITERKKADEALQESEERLRVTLEETRIGTWDWDVQRDVWNASPTYFTMLGYAPEKGPADRQVWLERLHPDDRAMVAEKIRGVLNGEVVKYQYEARIRHADGSYRWHAVLGNTIKRDDKGRPARIIGVRLDITDRKLSEEGLQESERALKEAQRLARIGNWSLDLASNRLDWSDEIFRIFELDQARFGASYEAFLDAIHPEDRETVNKAYTESLKNKTRYDIAHRLLMKDGRIKYVNECCETFYDAAGRPLRSVGTVQDITERKLAEEALRASEAAVRYKLQALLSPEGELAALELGDILDVPALQAIMDEFYELTKIGIGIIDMKGKVLVGTGWQEICTKFHRVNPDTARNCFESDTVLSEGVEPGKCKSYLCKNNLRDIATPIIVGGKHLGNLFLGQFLYDDEPYAPELFRLQARRYGFDEKEYLAAYERLPRFGREQVDVVMRFYIKFSELVSTLSYGKIKLARALAESRQAQLEKEDLNLKLAAKNQEMENFLYITTHDLRSPLVNIQGFSQNLEHYIRELKEGLEHVQAPRELKAGLEKLTAEKIPAALEFVLGSSRKMDALISALLKVSRVGRVEMKPERIEMSGLLQRVLDAMRFQLEEAGAEVKAGVLPPCKADPVAVNQVLSNLLDNALKYRDGSRRLVVEAAGEVKGDRALYTISDNGPGIPGKDLERIWNVFYSHERTAQRKGEGIGLPLVRRLVEKNGGSVKAESKEGQGTVFYLDLPAAGEEK